MSRCPVFNFQYRCCHDEGHDGVPHHFWQDDGERVNIFEPQPGEDVANATWRKGFVHLTVDSEGLVSLWDEEHGDESSYVKLKLTSEQMRIIVVKSSNHFRADFQPHASHVLVAKAAGPMAADPGDLPWKNLSAAVRRRP